MNDTSGRRDFLKLGMAGLATAGVLATVDAQKAAAQAAPDSLLRTVLDRGKLIVGTGSTNAPWHFENDAGELVLSPSVRNGGSRMPHEPDKVKSALKHHRAAN